jgi:hypothetical protein
MYAMREDAHAAFRFITQTVITIVTMQQTEVKEEKNRTERVYEACHAYHMYVRNSKAKKARHIYLRTSLTTSTCEPGNRPVRPA